MGHRRKIITDLRGICEYQLVLAGMDVQVGPFFISRKATVSNNGCRVAATLKMSQRCPWMAQTTTARGQKGSFFGV